MATRIKRAVELNGWDQAQVARLCGQSQPTVCDILSGRLARFPQNTLLKFLTVLEFHSKENPVAQRTLDSANRISEIVAELVAERPIKGKYAWATLGSKTKWGGEVVTATTAIYSDGHRIARVGDLVRYPDGSQCEIVSGAGQASVFEGKPIALVGSHLSNGDTIEMSLRTDGVITEFADDVPTPGLLQPGYDPTALVH